MSWHAFQWCPIVVTFSSVPREFIFLTLLHGTLLDFFHNDRRIIGQTQSVPFYHSSFTAECNINFSEACTVDKARDLRGSDSISALSLQTCSQYNRTEKYMLALFSVLHFPAKKLPKFFGVIHFADKTFVSSNENEVRCSWRRPGNLFSEGSILERASTLKNVLSAAGEYIQNLHIVFTLVLGTLESAFVENSFDDLLQTQLACTKFLKASEEALHPNGGKLSACDEGPRKAMYAVLCYNLQFLIIAMSLRPFTKWADGCANPARSRDRSWFQPS